MAKLPSQQRRCCNISPSWSIEPSFHLVNDRFPCKAEIFLDSFGFNAIIELYIIEKGLQSCPAVWDFMLALADSDRRKLYVCNRSCYGLHIGHNRILRPFPEGSGNHASSHAETSAYYAQLQGKMLALHILVTFAPLVIFLFRFF